MKPVDTTLPALATDKLRRRTVVQAWRRGSREGTGGSWHAVPSGSRTRSGERRRSGAGWK